MQEESSFIRGGFADSSAATMNYSIAPASGSFLPLTYAQNLNYPPRLRSHTSQLQLDILVDQVSDDFARREFDVGVRVGGRNILYGCQRGPQPCKAEGHTRREGRVSTEVFVAIVTGDVVVRCLGNDHVRGWCSNANRCRLARLAPEWGNS